MKISQNTFNEVFFEPINGNDFIDRPSAEIYQQTLDPQLQVPNCLYIICGTDSGLLPNYINQRYGDDVNAINRHFLFVELQPILDLFGDISLQANLKVIGSEQSLFELLLTEYREFLTADNCHVVLSQAAKSCEFYPPLVEQLNNTRQRLVFGLTECNYDQISLTNLQRNVLPINHYKKDLAGLSAAVLAAGPSLDQHLSWVKQHQQQLVVFAIGRVAKKVSDYGIGVDFVVSIDPTEISYQNSCAMLSLTQINNQSGFPSILLNAQHIHPKLLAEWQGHNLFFGKALPWCRSQQTENSMIGGNSVGHAAFSQAVYLGCQQIYLLGMDLCFSDNFTHHGKANESLNLQNQLYQLDCQNYAGETSKTNANMFEGQKFLAKSVVMFKKIEPKLKVFNLSSKAAVIEGIGLFDIVNKPADVDKTVLLIELQQKLDAEKSYIRNQSDYYSELIKDELKLYRHWHADIELFLQQTQLSDSEIELKIQAFFKAIDCRKEWLESYGFIEFERMQQHAQQAPENFYRNFLKSYQTTLFEIIGILAEI